MKTIAIIEVIIVAFTLSISFLRSFKRLRERKIYLQQKFKSYNIKTSKGGHITKAEKKEVENSGAILALDMFINWFNLLACALMQLTLIYLVKNA